MCWVVQSNLTLYHFGAALLLVHATLQLQAQMLFVACRWSVVKAYESVKAEGCFEEVTLSMMEGGGVTLSSVYCTRQLHATSLFSAKIHGLLLFSRCGLWEGWSCYELLDFVWILMCWIVDHWKLAATKWTGKRTRKRAEPIEPLACEDGKPARQRHSGRTICASLNRQLLDDLMLRSPWCIAWWPLFKYRTTNWVRLESQHLHHI